MLTILFFWNYWARTSRNIGFYFQKWDWSLLVLSLWEFVFAFSNVYISFSTWSLTENQHFSPLTCLTSITERSAKLVLGTEPCGLVMHWTVHSNFHNKLNLSWTNRTCCSWKLPHSTIVVDTALKILQTAVIVWIYFSALEFKSCTKSDNIRYFEQCSLDLEVRYWVNLN